MMRFVSRLKAFVSAPIRDVVGKGIYVATAGATARQRQIEVVANNVANASTPGFRKVGLAFEEVLGDDLNAPNRHLVGASEPRLSTEAGPIQETGRDLDLALTGDGYFVTEDFAGNQFLQRTVSLRLTEDGKFVDSAGRELRMDHSGEVDPNKAIAIDARGMMTQEDQVIGRIEVRALFENEAALEPVGGGAYTTNERSGPGLPVETSHVVQGALEGSNVVPVESMVELITAEREFQSLTKVIQAYREADDALIDSTNR